MEDKEINEHIKKLQREGKAMTDKQMEEVAKKNQRIFEAIERKDFTTLKGLGVIPEQVKKGTEEEVLFIAESRELTKQRLQDNYDLNKGQITLFDTLGEEVQSKIQTEEEGEKRLVLEYLHLSQAEVRLISTLSNLLYTQNKTDSKGRLVLKEKNIKSSSQFSNRPTPILTIKSQELYKEYTGKKNPSGRDRERIYNTLQELTKSRVFVWENEKKIERDYIPYLFSKEIIPTRGLTEEEKEEIKSTKGALDNKFIRRIAEYKIILNPVFHSQWYLLRPRDLEIVTAKLIGGGRGSNSIYKLRDYLLDILSREKYATQIGEEKLIYKLGLEKKYKKEGISKYIKEKIDTAIKTSIKLRIIKEYNEDEKNLLGEKKYTFILNKNFREDYGKAIKEETPSNNI